MNIAIYNGNLQPTTFVLRLALVVNEEHNVLIAGTSSKLFKYKNKGLCYLPTDSKNKLLLIAQFVLSLLTFFCVYPKKCLYILSLLRHSKKPIKTKLKQFLIWSKFISNSVDVVHIQWASHINMFEEVLDASYFKTVVSLRGRLINITPHAEPNLKVLYQKTFPKIHQFHAVTHHIKKQAMIYGAEEAKIKVIYSGVEVSTFEQFKKTDYSKGETLKILSVGRQHWKKGYNYALEAFAILLHNKIKASYTIIGAADSEEVVFTVKDLKIEDDVKLTSKMDYKDVLKEMQNADVLVLPSVSEGLANVVIEAMALGLPVISTNAVGMPELVNDNETGLLFKNRDVDDLVEKLMDFNTLSQKDIEIISANALQKVIEQHNWNSFKQGFNELFQKTYDLKLSKNVFHSIDELVVNTTNFNNIKNFKTKNKKLQIVTVASLNWAEGLDHAINAMKLLKEENLDFEYHIIGTGTPKEIERYTFQIHQNQLQNHVFFYGKLSKKEQLIILSSADIYLQPSLQEGLCKTVLEAQKKGVLCVITNTGELTENVTHPKTSWLVPKRAPKLIAKKIIDIINLFEDEKDAITKNVKE